MLRVSVALPRPRLALGGPTTPHHNFAAHAASAAWSSGPVCAPLATQTLREGDKYTLQLAGGLPGTLGGAVPGGLLQKDGTTMTLEYSAPWLPGGVTRNSETGWIEWTPEQLGVEDLKFARGLVWLLDALVSGGYFDRHAERAKKYNAGGYGTDQVVAYHTFTNANSADMAATMFGTVATFGNGTKIAPMITLAKAGRERALAYAATGGFLTYGFNMFEQLRDIFLFSVTNGVDGRRDASLREALTMGGFGFAGGAATPFALKGLENFFKKISDALGIGASRAKHIGIQSDVIDATAIRVNGKVLANTPRADSMALEDASRWFRDEVARLAKSADGTLTVQGHITELLDLREKALAGAKAALYDAKKLSIHLDDAFGVGSLDDLYARVTAAAPGNLSGDALDAAVLEELKKTPAKKFSFEATTCFAAGTLVHTANGLVPIEQIKVGNLVYSKPENGEGEVALKPVTKVFAHGPTQIVQLFYQRGERAEGEPCERLFTTPEHPFWVNGQGWMEARELSWWPGEEKYLSLIDGDRAFSSEVATVYRTAVPHTGWISYVGHMTDELGFEWNFENQCVARRGVESLEDVREGTTDEVVQKVPVYNIEVSDNHTYYVGAMGVLVHNKNSKDAISVKNNGAELPAGTKTFFSDQY